VDLKEAKMSFSIPNTNINNNKRAKGLRKLGVSEEDVLTAERILAEIPPPPRINVHTSSKVEVLLGYCNSRLRREKALKILGANEEEVDRENSKVLGSLGISGRRRSYMDNNRHTNLIFLPSSRGSSRRRNSFGGIASIQRKHKAEIKKLRTEMNTQQMEVKLLKEQLELLQRALVSTK